MGTAGAVEVNDAADIRNNDGSEAELSLPSGAASASDGFFSPSDAEQSLERVSSPARLGWPVVDWLPISLAVGLPVSGFRVRDLLALEVGSVISTEWPNGDDLPLSAGSVQLAWVDMETVEQAMAVRLTRLL